ncbi:MAG TPA: type II secretion system protein N [Gammaproteobacteria bacterium]
MSLRSPRWALAALALLLVFLVLTLPAPHFLGWFGGGRVAAQGIEGTAWRGRVERVAIDGFPLGPVVWQMRPLALLAGRLEYQLFVQSGSGGGELRFGRSLFGSTRVSDAQLTLPAAEAGRRLGLTMATLDGDFHVDIADLSLVDGWADALEGQALWQKAQVLQPSPLPLGTLQMQLGLREGRIVGALSDDPNGPLELSGEFVLGAERQYQLDALIKPRAGADPQLREALGLLGNPDAQGRYRLQYSGTL